MTEVQFHLATKQQDDHKGRQVVLVGEKGLEPSRVLPH